jgi:hypothetical protein
MGLFRPSLVRFLKPVFCSLLLAASALSWTPQSAAAAAPSEFKKVAVPFLEKNCLECHGGKQTKADLDLKKFLDDSNILKEQKVWRNIVQQVSSGEMPPKKAKVHPAKPEIESFLTAIDNTLVLAHEKLPPDPGRVTIRRLNRKEYNNTVRDLLAVDYSPAENFPADDIGHGFDNISDVLSISPVHLERYLDAAEGVVARSILLELPKPATRTTSSNFLQPRSGSENSRRPVTNSPAELYTFQTIPIDGDYVFQVNAFVGRFTNGEPVKMTLYLADKELETFTVTNSPSYSGGGSSGRRTSTPYEVKLKLTAGEHRIAMLYIRDFKIVGPADARTEFMKRLDAFKATLPEARQVPGVVDWFLTRTFRRTPTPEESARYQKIFADGLAATSKFEGGLQQVARVALSSPKFLFRVELDDKPRTPDAHALDEFQLASRLSYFLWSTMPDEELLALAARKQLTPNLEKQVARMLKDPRADSLVRNFGLQWLQLERLSTFAPDKTLFPEFDDNLRRAMQRETELFLGEIIREDRSVLDLIDADFTYLNRTLAQHYGIKDDRLPSYEGRYRGSGSRRSGGSDFVRVTLPSKQRGGLLTQASILAVTSNPTRTSPVKRGKWVLEQILGTPPPPPPPGVAELDGQKKLTGTLRQRMEQHRADPQCASCHTQMDAMGFAFENFDALGRFRSKDGDATIDPAGELPDGSKFQGPGELKEILKGKKELVVRNLTEKLMTYALGRGLEYYDDRAVRKIGADMAKADYKFSALVAGIVKSDPFRLRRGTKLSDQAAGSE